MIANVVPFHRNRELRQVESDLREGLRSVCFLADELDARALTQRDVGTIDATCRGLLRLLTEMRVALDPPRQSA
jgi:hypothetical protein